MLSRSLIQPLAFPLIISLGLIGCTATKQFPDNGDYKPSSSNTSTGFILLSIQTQDHLEKVKMTGSSNITFYPESTLEDGHYFLAEVTAGKYRFSTVKTGLHDVELYSGYNWDFTIQANTINYIGHLEMDHRAYDRECRCAKILLANKSSQAIDYLRKHQERLFKAIPTSYQGPEQDSYIEYALSLLADKD